MWKFAIILKNKTSYLNKTDIEMINSIKEKFLDNLNPNYDSNGVIYFLEDVNCPKIDSLHFLLKNNGIENQIVSTVKWKEFSEIN